MSIFTTELRYPIEQYQDEHDMARRVYDAGIYRLLGLDEYPIFEESYRATLNNKIIEHYYFKEIGTDTLARFRWYMRTTMSEIMPRFNILYQAQNSVVDPMTNRNLSWREVWTLAETGGSTTDRDGGTTYGRIENRENGGTDKQTAGRTTDKVIHSETPMNELQTGAVENGNYATDVTFTTREGQTASETEYGGTTEVTTSGRDETDSTTKYTGGLDTDGEKTHTDVGYDGTTPTALLAELAEKFVNIDVMVIDTLSPLFMGLWE